MAERAKSGVGKFFTSFLPEKVGEGADSDKANPAQAPVSTKPVASVSASLVVGATVDQELVDRIMKAVLAKPSSYTKFLEVIARLSGVAGLNRDAQIQATLAVQGMSGPAVSLEIDTHLNVLQGQRGEFDASIARQKETLDSRNAEVAKIEAQIAQLQERATSLRKENDGVQQTMAGAAQNFEAAFAFVQTQLVSDKKQLAGLK